MKRKRRTEITVETEQVLIIRRTGQPMTAWCQQCGAEVVMITPEEAARGAGASLRAIRRLVEAGQLHFRESANGRLFICLNSSLKEKTT